LYSHQCIYVYIELPIYTRYISTGCMRCLRTSQGALEDDNRVNSEIHSEAVIEWVWRCTWRPKSSELRDALGGRDRASSEMHVEARVSTKIYPPRPCSSEFGDPLERWDRASLEMHLPAIIEWDWRGTFGGGWFGCNQWEARRVQRLYWSVSWLKTVGMWRGDFTFDVHIENWLVVVDPSGGTPDAWATSRGLLVILRMKERLTNLGVCCTRCMLHSVLTLARGMER